MSIAERNICSDYSARDGCASESAVPSLRLRIIVCVCACVCRVSVRVCVLVVVAGLLTGCCAERENEKRKSDLLRVRNGLESSAHTIQKRGPGHATVFFGVCCLLCVPVNMQYRNKSEIGYFRVCGIAFDKSQWDELHFERRTDVGNIQNFGS